MNSRKVRYSCVVVCLSVLLGSSWTAPAVAAGEIFLKSEKFALAPPEASTAIVPILLSGPGKLILEVTTTQQIGQLGIVVRGAYPNAASHRKDGPAGSAPLRMEIQVTSQEFQKGAMWFAFPTLRRANNSLYPSPGVMLAGEIKVSFIPASSSTQTGASPPVTTVSAVLPNPSGFTATAGTGGDVILKWSPVPNAIYYSLQGSGVASVSGMPPNVSATTYTVKGLPAGTHSWVLFAVYSGPSGPYWGNESNPSRTSMTIAPPAAQVVPPPAAKTAVLTGTKLPLLQGSKIPQTGASPPVTTVSAVLPNPSGFTATAVAGGDVILKWSPVKDAIYYSLQGAGVASVSGMPPNVSGTTYTVKGLPAGTHSWVLFAVYSGPSGPYWGDERNPARTSMTIAPPAAQVVPPPVTTAVIPTGTKLPLLQGSKIPQTGASPPTTTAPPVTAAPPAAPPTQAVPQSAAKTAVLTGTQMPLPQGSKIPQTSASRTVPTVATTPPNPSGFTATVGDRGYVILKWSPVPGVPYYCLQGPGTPNQPLGAPPYVTGTTYPVKGLPPGTHSWVLLSGPVCDFTNANPPARTSATVSRLSGRYRVTINGLRVNNATVDTMLQTDGKGDEIFVVVDLQEMNAIGNVAEPTASFKPWPGQTRDTFVYGDTNGFPSRKKAGSLSSMGGLRSGDTIPNVPEPWKRSGPPLQKEFPLFVWEGNLVDGQNAVLISPAIWEQDSTDKITPVFNTVTTIWGLTFKPMWDSLSTGFVDPKALHRVIFGEDFTQTFSTASDLVGGITSHGTTLLKELAPEFDLNPLNWLSASTGSLFGESKDRPIGMIKSGDVYKFEPWIFPLNYATAEASLAPNSYLTPKGPGILEPRFVDAPALAGDYTLYLQIERVQ